MPSNGLSCVDLRTSSKTLSLASSISEMANELATIPNFALYAASAEVS